MIHTAKRVYKNVSAHFMLLTVETILALTLFILAFAVFLCIAKMIFLDNKAGFDKAAFNYLSSMISPRNNGIMLFFTALGNYQFLVIANLLLFCWFIFIRKHNWYSIKIGSIALSSAILMLLLKQWFNRKRPPVPLLDPAIGLSFPSGHAMSSVTFYGLLIYFIWKNKDVHLGLRIGLLVFFVSLILVIGLSRVYLRVHYASDVIGGFCAGVIWLILSVWAIKKIETYSKNKLAKP